VLHSDDVTGDVTGDVNGDAPVTFADVLISNTRTHQEVTSLEGRHQMSLQSMKELLLGSVSPPYCVRLCSLLGRLFDRVDLIKPISIVRPSVCAYVRPSARKKFLRFQ